MAPEDEDTLTLPLVESEPDPDPAATSAASDPLPGGRRRGRPMGSKNRTQTEAQRAASVANLAKGAARSRAQRAQRVGPTDRQLEDAISGFYVSIGFAAGWIGQDELGRTVAECSTAAATAWLHLAQQNPAVRRLLVQLTSASAASELLVAHAPIMALAMSRMTGNAAPPVEPAPTAAPFGTPFGANGATAAQSAPGYVG